MSQSQENEVTVNGSGKRQGLADVGLGLDLRPKLEAAATEKIAAGDPSKYRLSQDYVAMAAGRRVITVVPIKKPNKQSFVRVHPDPDWHIEVGLLEFKELGETYVVSPFLVPELGDDVVPMVLFTTVDRQGSYSLWPVRLPGVDGRTNSWNESALEAAHQAMKAWVRVASNMSLGGYDVHQSLVDLAEPAWPSMTFDELLKIAFRGRCIDDIGHPALKRLRGEV